jgi:hypothetical protein
MKKTIALFLLATVFLGGCSGRSEDTATDSDTADVSGGSGSLTIGAAEQVEVGDIRLLSAKPSLNTGVGDVTVITAVVTDASNRAISGYDVDFSSDGGVLQNVQATTNESGEAIAELSLAGDYRNRNISVIAEVEGESAEVLIAATGTIVQMDAPTDLLTGDTAPVIFTLTAGDNQPIPNQTLTVSSTAGNTLSESTLVTDALGQARLDVGTTEGSDTLMVSGLEGSVSQSFSLTVAETVADLVTDLRIRVISDQSSIETGGRNVARVTTLVTDEANRAVPNFNVSFRADGGILQNIETTTSETGEASAELSLAGDYRNRNITVTATVGDDEASLQIAATGTTLSIEAPNDLIVGQTGTITLTLTAGDGQPIPNQEIAIASAAGNTLSDSTLITNAAGQVVFTMGTDAGTDTINASALDGTVAQAFPIAVATSVQDVATEVRIRVISNESAIETGGNDIARITTLVTDESNRVISGKEVDFSSSGGVLQNISSTTNEAGQATAELSLAGDYRNQEITVEAKVDDQVGSVKVTTSGSAISIAGPTALVLGNTAELEITLSGGNDQPIANEPIEILSSAGNTISNASPTTNASGKVLVTVGSLAGDDVITVNALDTTVSSTHVINVAEDILEVQAVTGVDYDALPVDSFWPFEVRWENNGNPVVGQQLKFGITAGVVRQEGSSDTGSSSVLATTDASGVATIEVKSNSAGPATIAFADDSDSDPFSQFDIEFVAFNVTNIDVAAAPASVATGNPSTVSATVTDDFGNPVKDVVVEFSSPDLRGGNLSPVTAVTDSDGRARITFTAGSLPTQDGEISIVATAAETPSVEDNVRMTVTERQLNVIIGLAGTVAQADNDTRYLKAGVVQVTDGVGRPVPDASILVTIDPMTYRYGQMITVDINGDGEPDQWARAIEFSQDHADAREANGEDPADYPYSHTCAAEDKNGNRILDTTVEDLNGNGVLDSGEDTNANGILDVDEDINGNGVLDPRDPALITEDQVNTPTVIGGEITTDSNGVGFFSLAYPQSNALWFDVSIVARVQALGTESVAEYETPLAVAANDIEDPEVEPPNRISPYGVFDYNNPPVCNQP